MKENNILHLKWGKNKSAKSQKWFERQNRRIKRHSKVVFWVKTLMPILAVCLFLLVFIWPYFTSNQDDSINLVAKQTPNKQILDEQVMIHPHLFTIDQENKPINVFADKAIDLPTETKMVELINIEADYLLKDRFLELVATRGVYTKITDELELLDKVDLYTDDGYHLDTTQTKILFKDPEAKPELKNKFKIVGNQKTRVYSAMGDSTSEGFEILAGGTIIRLTGKTTIIFNGQKGDKE